MRGFLEATEPFWKECTKVFLRKASERLGQGVGELLSEKLKRAAGSGDDPKPQTDEEQK